MTAATKTQAGKVALRKAQMLIGGQWVEERFGRGASRSRIRRTAGQSLRSRAAVPRMSGAR